MSTSVLLNTADAVAGEGIDEAVAWHYGQPAAEQKAFEQGYGLVDLSHYGVIEVTGPQRLEWLNSITSQRLDNLEPGVTVETLVLSVQGRIEYAALTVDDGTSTWLLVDPGQRDGLAAWLRNMVFAMRVEVRTDDAWGAVATWGKAFESQGVVWHDPWPNTLTGGTTYRIDDADPEDWDVYYTLVRDDELEAAGQRWIERGGVLAGTWAFEACRVAAWRPRVVSEVDERSIVHELDWLRTAVHLTKGCYRGQETVARVHNLGRPPRRLVMLHLDGSVETLPARGDDVLLGEKSVGQVTSAARHRELGPIALAIVRRNTPVEDLVVVHDEVKIAAAQDVIVNTEGVAPTRPEPRPETMRGVGRGNPNMMRRG